MDGRMCVVNRSPEIYVHTHELLIECVYCVQRVCVCVCALQRGEKKLGGSPPPPPMKIVQRLPFYQSVIRGRERAVGERGS